MMSLECKQTTNVSNLPSDMATRSAIAAVVDKTPSQSTRNVKLRRWGQEILDKACQGERVIEYFDSFCTWIAKTFSGYGEACKYQSHSAQRTYLWSTFHRSRVNKDLTKKWKEMLYKLNVNVDTHCWSSRSIKKCLKCVCRNTMLVSLLILLSAT